MAKKKKIAKSMEVAPFDPSKIDYNEAIKYAMNLQMAAQQIPQIVSQQIQKGWQQLPNTNPVSSPKAWFLDPLNIQYSIGYKDRKFSLSYDVLKRVVNQLGILAAVINTRIAQVCAFCEPYRNTKSLGFVIKHKDPDHPTSYAEVAFIKELEKFIANCGRSEPNPYSKVKRDDFESFLKKIVRDSLTYDQIAVEIVPDMMGIPYEFLAVDAATVRIADEGLNQYTESYASREGFVPENPRYPTSFGGNSLMTGDGNPISYIQLINGQPNQAFSDKELVFACRNPRTDIYIQGYGFSEVEMIITIITSFLNAEEYNRRIFTNGTTAKGILNFKGDTFSPEMLEALKRQWIAQAAGVENAHRTLITQSEGMEWQDLQKGNAEMEYNKWIEYLIKLVCGTFLIDPAEVNFSLQGGVSQTPLFESSQEWKLKASRDKGLKPLLKFIAKVINKNIIDRIDDHFSFEFIGLDELSQQEQHQMLVEQLGSYLSLNEVRKSQDLPEVKYGDLVLNPTYVQYVQQREQMEAQQQQQEQMGQQQQAAATNQVPGENQAVVDPGPQYTTAFNRPSG